jgi:hypothetical protein
VTPAIVKEPISGGQACPHAESLAIRVGQLAELETRCFKSIEQVFGFDFA